MVKRLSTYVLTLLLCTSCSYTQVDTPISQDLSSSGIVFTTNMHSLIPRSLSTDAVRYFNPKYLQNRRTADSFFVEEKNWEAMESSVEYFLTEYPNAYQGITREDFTLSLAGLVYDELFRRDFADDAEEEALRRGITDDNFYWNTIGIGQISPAIHRGTISQALGEELSLENAAKKLLSSQDSIRVIPYILYDNHPSNLPLAVTRYHSGTVSASDARAEYILGEELRNHILSLREE